MRYLLLDRVLEIEPGRSIRAIRNVTLTEDVLATHFPNFPILPGVIITDTLVQAASWAWAANTDFMLGTRLHTLREAKFRRYVRPGDQLVVEAQWTHDEGIYTVWKAKALVNGKPVASIREVVLAPRTLSVEVANQQRTTFNYCAGSLKAGATALAYLINNRVV